MGSTVRKIRGGVAGAAVAAALAFGALAALAPVPAQAIPACRDKYAAGSCGTQAQCQQICDAKGPGLIAYCNTSTYCCSCLRL